MVDQNEGAPANVPPSEAKALVEGEYTLLDVRTPEEHAQGAVPGSINIPVKLDDGKGGFVDNPQFLEQVKEQVGLEKPLVCTCAHGRRGALAAKQLADAGLEQVVNLEGGLANWADLDLPHTGTIKRHH
ncbi:hypothetical protein COHA_009547 [Chlorella ohadii]|uniref:Rhodanese domain-containing protein n=1 Tax=Chlorella ohadii TaxID=2649997 RepID=A0AAD5GXR4_9CHLO|nr:hypothetical protein COHA_009547 [Chlorella ohadii]